MFKYVLLVTFLFAGASHAGEWTTKPAQLCFRKAGVCFNLGDKATFESEEECKEVNKLRGPILAHMFAPSINAAPDEQWRYSYNCVKVELGEPV